MLGRAGTVFKRQDSVCEAARLLIACVNPYQVSKALSRTLSSGTGCQPFKTELE